MPAANASYMEMFKWAKVTLGVLFIAFGITTVGFRLINFNAHIISGFFDIACKWSENAGSGRVIAEVMLVRFEGCTTL